MTPLEDRVREALRGKAGEVPPYAVPPLRLPARRRRFFSLAYGGGERKEAPAGGWSGWLAPAAAAVVVAIVIAGSLAVSHVIRGRGRAGSYPQAATAIMNEAAAWSAAQVSRSARVSCDPVMCRVLAAHRIPAGDLDMLKPGAVNPLRSDVIVATAAVRREFGARLSSVYAPGIIASFGSGSTRVDIRVIAPHGAAAYRLANRADLRSRKMTGSALSNNDRIMTSTVAKKQLQAGHVDTRVMTVLTGLAVAHPVSIVAFGHSGPGAPPGVPLRSMELAPPGDTTKASRTFALRAMLAILQQQSPPFRPARAAITHLPDGQAVLRVEFAAPSPVGLLGTGPYTAR